MSFFPNWLKNWFSGLFGTGRPHFSALEVDDEPDVDGIDGQIIYIEVRDGYKKWAHLKCPLCGDHIQLPLAGKSHWTISVDSKKRPTLSPSVWEKQTCGAHFFVRGGHILWCEGPRNSRAPAPAKKFSAN